MRNKVKKGICELQLSIDFSYFEINEQKNYK